MNRVSSRALLCVHVSVMRMSIVMNKGYFYHTASNHRGYCIMAGACALVGTLQDVVTPGVNACYGSRTRARFKIRLAECTQLTRM